MMEFIEPGCMRSIDKNYRCALNKAPSGNWLRECVLHRSVCAARTHAALLPLDALSFRWILLRRPGVHKQRRTNGLYCGGAENAPSLAETRGWHQAPNGRLTQRHLPTKAACRSNPGAKDGDSLRVVKSVERLVFGPMLHQVARSGERN